MCRQPSSKSSKTPLSWTTMMLSTCKQSIMEHCSSFPLHLKILLMSISSFRALSSSIRQIRPSMYHQWILLKSQLSRLILLLFLTLLSHSFLDLQCPMLSKATMVWRMQSQTSKVLILSSPTQQLSVLRSKSSPKMWPSTLLSFSLRESKHKPSIFTIFLPKSQLLSSFPQFRATWLPITSQPPQLKKEPSSNPTMSNSYPLSIPIFKPSSITQHPKKFSLLILRSLPFRYLPPINQPPTLSKSLSKATRKQ